jgi:hypothetical protein
MKNRLLSTWSTAYMLALLNFTCRLT